MPSRRDVIGGTLGAAGSLPLVSGRARAASASTRDRLAEDLRRHASFGDKWSGSPGDLATSAWIRQRLQRSGFAVERVEFEVPRFEAATSRLTVGEKAIEVAPQPIVVATPPEGVQAQGVLVREPFEAAAAKGRIAFLVLPYDRHAAIFMGATPPLLEPAVAAGASAIVIVPTGPTGLIVGLNTRLKPMAPVPIAVMAPRDLPMVARAVAEGRPLTLTVTGRSGVRASNNLIAHRRAGDAWLAFSTPRSGWYGCVGERGTGTAAFLELCDWAARRFPRHSIFAVNSGGHELDFVGMHKALPLGPPPGRTQVWTHLGAGLATRDLLTLGVRTIGLLPSADPQRVLMTSEALFEPGRRLFAGLSGLERPIPTVGGAGELSSIIDLGYSRAFAVLGVHRWCHTVDDTLDKVDADLLLPVVQAHKALVAATVAATPL